MNTATPIDFARRRSAHQTASDRRRLQQRAREAANEHEQLMRRTLRTEFTGGFVLGFIWGAGIVAGFWLLRLWVDAGGAP